MSIRFEYELEEAGWARFAVIDGERRVSGRSGWFYDPLKDLSRWAINWLGGERGPAYIAFHQEPEMFVCRMERPGENVVLDCRELGGLWDPWQNWDEVAEASPALLQAEEDPRRLAVGVCLLLDGLWRRHGVADYAARWIASSFPLAELLHLRLCLDSNPLAAEIVSRVANRPSSIELELELLRSTPDIRTDGPSAATRHILRSGLDAAPGD